MKKTLIIVFCLYLAGCVAGQEYDYEASSMYIPIKPSENRVLILSVEDIRAYVLSGDKDADFVGLQRGGFGEPWDVTTSSGKPMAEDMSAAITSGLKGVGYNVFNVTGKKESNYLIDAASNNGASRIAVLKVIDWKSDVFMGVSLNSNLHLSVMDAKGNLLAESRSYSVEKIASGSWATTDDNAKALAEEFSKRIRDLFSTDEVRKALE